MRLSVDNLAVFCLLTSLVSAQQTPVPNTNPRLQDFDSLGTWYNGVAGINATTTAPRPNATIAIVGAGISGLTTALLLESVGVHNWEIIEASSRVGGRFRTKFFEGIGRTEWVELGPMRLPYSVKYKSDGSVHNYTDHHLVLQLAGWLNDLNNHEPSTLVEFIPWIQHSPNELIGKGTKKIDGRTPTRAELAAHPEYSSKPAITTTEYNDTKKRINEILFDEQRLKRVQANVWKEHSLIMAQGYDDTSEQDLLRNVFGASENVTDALLTSWDYDIVWDHIHHNSNLQQDGSSSALGETTFVCVKDGFNKLGDAFLPLVEDRLFLNQKVTKIEDVKDASQGIKNNITWKDSSGKVGTKEYDYTIITAPFTVTRFLELPSFSSVLSRAMSDRGLRFKSACKVALLFKERFWEKGDNPIFGGYSQPANQPVGALYYPVYGLNETGRPGAIIHYRGGDWSDRFVSFTDQQHVELVLDVIVELHGEQARELYTGQYERLCFLTDEFSATAWARPSIEQHKLYIPSYHTTEHNIIFIGEHTAPTHAWVSSSLYSAVRGTIQLLLEIGLVDEAKAINEKWMGQWIARS